jgi:hypothetical protein
MIGGLATSHGLIAVPTRDKRNRGPENAIICYHLASPLQRKPRPSTAPTSSGSFGLHESGRPSSFKSNRAGNRPSEIGPAGNLAKPFIGPWRSPGIWSTSVSRQRPSASQMRHGYPPVSTQPQMIQQDAISIFFQMSHFVAFRLIPKSSTLHFLQKARVSRSAASERPGIGGVSHSLHTGCQGYVHISAQHHRAVATGSPPAA